MVNDIIREAARRLTNSPEPLLDARVLLAHAARSKNAAMLFRDITPSERQTFEKYIEMRQSGIPVAYILNNKEFMGHDFYVDENTLIPRPDTECLVEHTAELGFDAPRILDLCTGSGCIGISLVLMLEKATAVLADISEGALRAAKKNIRFHKVGERVQAIKLDVLKEPFPQGFDIIVSNPPYIPTGVLPSLEVSKTEPLIALDGGGDGLTFYRAIIKKSAEVLAPRGALALEIGFDQGEAVKAIAMQHFGEVTLYKDYGHNDRVVICRKT